MAETKRPVSEGAEALINQKVDVLDKGFIYLVDYMGDDLSVEEAARVSYGPGTKRTSSGKSLINYLRRHEHTSPSEMIELKFHVKMPIFVARQWVRHRTASLNEISGRYSVMPEEFYIPSPENFSYQSDTNNQGRGGMMNAKDAEAMLSAMEKQLGDDYITYTNMVDAGVAREIARLNLPLSLYTEMYWKVDLHNLFHFLRLRMDSHAQFEIREYADAMAEIIKRGWPVNYRAFEVYNLNSIRFSEYELRALAEMLQWGIGPEDAMGQVHSRMEGISQREYQEFSEKIERVLSLW